MREINRKEFLDRQYSVTLTKSSGRFYLLIDELGIVASSDHIQDALEILEAQKEDYFEAKYVSGQTGTIPLPKGKTVGRQYLPFFIKSAVIALVGVFLITTASISFTYMLREPVRKASQKAARAVTKELVKGLEDFAHEGTSPERERKITASIRAAGPHLRPYIEELRVLFVSPLDQNQGPSQ